MDNKKLSSEQKRRFYWFLFIAAMGGFGVYNLYKALQSFGVIE